MPNFADNFEFYKGRELVIDDFDYETDGDIQVAYAEGGDGGNPTVVNASTAPLLKVGSYNGKFPITDSTHTSTFTADGTIPSQDATMWTGNALGIPTAGRLKVILTRSNTSQITGVTFRIGSSSSNYLTWTPTLPATTDEVVLSVDLTTLAATGTPDWTQLDYVQIRVTSASSTPNLQLSGLRMCHSDGVTDGVWTEVNSQLTNGQSDAFLSTRQVFATFLMPEGSGEEVIHVVKAKETDWLYYNGFTLTSKMRWQGAGSGKEIGLAFHVQDATAGSQDCYVAYFDEADDQINFDKYVGGTQSNIASFSYTPTNTSIYWLRVESTGGRFRILYSTDGLSYNTAIDINDSTYSSGRVGIYVKGKPVAEFFTFECYDLPYVKFDDWSFNQRGMVRLDNIQALNTADRNIQLLSIANSNKSVITNDNFKEKYVNVSGKIFTRESEGDFIKTVDDLKKHLILGSRLLRIGYPTELPGIFEDRVYQDANAVNLDSTLKPEYYHKKFVPFNVMFQIPVGVDQQTKTRSFKQYSWSSNTFTRTYEFLGSSRPQPVITFTMTDATGSSALNRLSVYNQRNGKQITFTPSTDFADGDEVRFDFENSVLYLNSSERPYEGVMNETFFETGKNALTFQITSQSTLDAFNDVVSSAYYTATSTGRKLAQSFQVSASTTYKTFGFPFGPAYYQVFLGVAVVGATPPPSYYVTSPNVTMRIETDSAGSPSGSLVDAAATQTIATTIPIGGYKWNSYYFPSGISLSTATTYWLVMSADGPFSIRHSNYNSYANGSAKIFNGSTWVAQTADLCFSTYSSGPTSISGTVDVNYRPRYA